VHARFALVARHSAHVRRVRYTAGASSLNDHDMSANYDEPKLEQTPGTGLLAEYAPRTDIYDELIDAAGEVRLRWRPVLEAFARMEPGERKALRENAERMLRENGVTFVAQGDEDRVGRPWQLDLFPMLIAPEEWRSLESGLSQRARLLNDVLVDLYGEQRALREGVLPPAMVFGNPRFLRPCAHAPVSENRHLQFLAFDLARAPDGRWWVLSDRTETPSGAGYALENRVVLSHCLPDLFANQNVRRQASFFRSFNDHFLSLAGHDEPTAVFLTRGPTKRTYFEHAYLARYLGYSIVEGSDLTVRDDRVYLKTVDGLKHIDLIMRSIRADMCDPLELRTDSLVGVPGLLQAVRAGKVTIANALGSGLVESDAFLSFLPGLSKYFLNEDLLIPSVATWWCGQEAERRYVLDNLDDLIVRRISSTRSLLANDKDGRIRPDLSSADRDELRAEIAARGHDFVGQERLSLASAPVWTGDLLRAAPVVLRMYVAATANGYEVMPGALARVSLGSDPRAAWLAAGDVSKDTWILSDEPVETFSLLAQRQDSTRLRRGTKLLPSRAADNSFWLGRYTERAEAAVRLLRSLVIRLRGETGSSRHIVPPDRVVSLLVVQKHLSARRGKRAMQQGPKAVERELWTILFDPECRDGLANVVDNVRRTAESVRERLSYDTYRTLKDLSDVVHFWHHSPRHEAEDALRLLNRLIQYLAAFNGLVMENMTRGYGWRFLDMGRRLERMRHIMQLTQRLTVRGDPEDDGALELLLELADSTMTYRGRYQASPQLPAVLDLLLCDDSNPRAALFQLCALEQHMRHLPDHGDGRLPTRDQRITTRVGADLKLADPVALSSSMSRFDVRNDLDRLLKRVERAVDSLADYIQRHYFSHSSPQRVSGTERSELR
jgi:uncharacterized circularly permuted ATP-grasp superfamily protein/uncharacterized alpha-E superfamily protein